MRRVLLALVFISVAGCAARPAPPAADGRSFSDNFDESHEMPAWKDHGGLWQLADEPTAPSQPHALQQILTTAEPAMFIATGHGTFGSVEVKVTFRHLPGNAAGAGIVVRYVDGENYYVVWTEDRGGIMRMEEHSRGNTTELARATRSFDGQGWSILTVRVQDDRFTVSIDSEQAFTAHDATLSVGHVGLWTPSGARTQFDDVVVARL